MDLQQTARQELVRFLVSKTMFCPNTGEVLDVGTCVVLNDRDGDPAYVLSQQGWRNVAAAEGSVEYLTSVGLTADPATVRNPEYLAANGHLMVTTEWTKRGQRVQHSAEHSENCACRGQEALPDW